jgi:hypothetical protein
MKARHIAVAGIAAAGVAALAGTGDMTMAQDRFDFAGKARVTVEVFSGRPDPTFTLSEAEVADIRRQLEGMKPAEAPAAGTGRLGYRGIKVESASGPGWAIIAADGTIRVDQKSAASYFADPGRKLETQILRGGQAQLDKNVYDHVIEQLKGATR